VSLVVRGGLIVTIEGERLIRLADCLDEQQIRRLYTYQAGIHTLIRENDPVITKIIITPPDK
jgi:hypothetical protein